MSIELKITGNTLAEVIQEMVGFTLTAVPQLRNGAGVDAPADAPADEVAADAANDEAAGSGGSDDTAPASKDDIDKLRQFVINDYLNACYETQPERSDAFRKMLDHFGLGKLNEAKAYQVEPIRKFVEKAIAEKVKG